jgi:hypothetical protein
MAKIMLRLSITGAAPSISTQYVGRHRVVPALAPRVAAGDTLYGEPSAVPGAEPSDSLNCVS